MASVFKRKGKKSGKWLIAYMDENGKRRTVTGTASKDVTKQIAAKLEGEVALRRRGCIDTRLDHYSQAERVPLIVRDGEEQIIGGHLGDFHAALVAAGNTSKHARATRTWAAAIIESCGTEHISDLTPSKAQAAIQQLRDDGKSLSTCNHYLRAIKQFTRWLWRDGRTRDDALAHLQSYNVKLDRRHDRRALTEDEVVRMIDAAEQGPVVLGMSGPERAMLYRVAVNTGFRAGELRSLTPESFALDDSPPTITVAAGYSKHREQDVQPIRTDLAAMLRPWLAGKESGQPVFNIPEKTAKMMRVDLAAADIEYRDGAGRVCDFHAWRHTFITNVVRSGAGVKTCQTLARHKDPQLTFAVYSHLQISDVAGALDKLPPVTPDEQVQRMRSAQTLQRAS